MASSLPFSAPMAAVARVSTMVLVLTFPRCSDETTGALERLAAGRRRLGSVRCGIAGDVSHDTVRLARRAVDEAETALRSERNQLSRWLHRRKGRERVERALDQVTIAARVCERARSRAFEDVRTLLHEARARFSRADEQMSTFRVPRALRLERKRGELLLREAESFLLDGDVERSLAKVRESLVILGSVDEDLVSLLSRFTVRPSMP